MYEPAQATTPRARCGSRPTSIPSLLSCATRHSPASLFGRSNIIHAITLFLPPVMVSRWQRTATGPEPAAMRAHHTAHHSYVALRFFEIKVANACAEGPLCQPTVAIQIGCHACGQIAAKAQRPHQAKRPCGMTLRNSLAGWPCGMASTDTADTA